MPVTLRARSPASRGRRELALPGLPAGSAYAWVPGGQAETIDPEIPLLIVAKSHHGNLPPSDPSQNLVAVVSCRITHCRNRFQGVS